jgi:hypothetical protein
MPRHPPYTLSSLTTFIDHRRDIFDLGFSIFDCSNTAHPTSPTSPIGRDGKQLRPSYRPIALDNGSNHRKGAQRHLAAERQTRTTYRPGVAVHFQITLNLVLFTCQRAALPKTARQSIPPNAGWTSEEGQESTSPAFAGDAVYQVIVGAIRSGRPERFPCGTRLC